MTADALERKLPVRETSGYAENERGVRELEPNDGFGSRIPAVVSGRDDADVARAEFLFFSIIHLDMQMARKHIKEMVNRTALSSNERLYVF